MATLTVPDPYPTIADAIAAASPGDTIQINRLTYVGNEAPVVTRENLTFESSVHSIDQVSNVVLTLGPGIVGATIGNLGGVQLIGNDLDNVLTGGPGADFFQGGGGDDTINGGTADPGNVASYRDAPGPVTVVLTVPDGLPRGFSSGADGNDTLTRIDDVEGSAFDDVLIGNDWQNGNRFWGNGGNDTIDGNGGFDQALYDDAPSGIVVTKNSFGVGSVSGGHGNDTLFDIEFISGTEYDDTIIGYSAAGNCGDDVLSGVGLSGGDGDDTLTGWGRMEGGNGNDRFNGDGTDDIYDGGPGIDTIDYSDETHHISVNLARTGPQSTGRGMDTFSGIEILIGSPLGNTFTGNQFANTFIGGAGIDTLRGGSGDDTLTALAGADLIIGDAGMDLVDGGDGIDRLYGGSGDDQLFGGAGAELARRRPAS